MHQNYRKNLLKIPEGAGALPRFGGCGADDDKCVSTSPGCCRHCWSREAPFSITALSVSVASLMP